jgi:hypothetical protein
MKTINCSLSKIQCAAPWGPHAPARAVFGAPPNTSQTCRQQFPELAICNSKKTGGEAGQAGQTFHRNDLPMGQMWARSGPPRAKGGPERATGGSERAILGTIRANSAATMLFPPFPENASRRYHASRSHQPSSANSKLFGRCPLLAAMKPNVNAHGSMFTIEYTTTFSNVKLG